MWGYLGFLEMGGGILEKGGWVDLEKGGCMTPLTNCIINTNRCCCSQINLLKGLIFELSALYDYGCSQT